MRVSEKECEPEVMNTYEVMNSYEVSQPKSTSCKEVTTGHRDFFLIGALELGDQDQAGQEGFGLTNFPNHSAT